MTAKQLVANCGSLSVRSLVGIPKLLTKCCSTIVATVVAVGSVFSVVWANSDNCSVITTMFGSYYLFSEDGPNFQRK